MLTPPPHGAELGDAGAPSAPPRRRDERRLFVLAGFVLLLIIGAGITILARSRARAELENETLENVVPTVSVIHPKRTPAQIQLELPGNITAFEEAPIYARVSGYLKRWLHGHRHARRRRDNCWRKSKRRNWTRNSTRPTPRWPRPMPIWKSPAFPPSAGKNCVKSDSVSQQDTDVRVATWHARAGECEGGRRPTSNA